MHIQMHFNDGVAAEALRSYLDRRLRFALARFGRRVGEIIVRVRPDGPSGNHCRISAEVLPFGQVAIEQADSDLFTAIDRATGKIGRQFSRELERMRNARVGRESVRLAERAI
jgi:ribosomal subunit interface protein